MEKIIHPFVNQTMNIPPYHLQRPANQSKEWYISLGCYSCWHLYSNISFQISMRQRFLAAFLVGIEFSAKCIKYMTGSVDLRPQTAVLRNSEEGITSALCCMRDRTLVGEGGGHFPMSHLDMGPQGTTSKTCWICLPPSSLSIYASIHPSISFYILLSHL